MKSKELIIDTCSIMFFAIIGALIALLVISIKKIKSNNVTIIIMSGIAGGFVGMVLRMIIGL